MDADRVVVWLAGRRHKVWAFLDTGAQVCFITKKVAKVLQPTRDGLKLKYVKVGRRWVKIQTCEVKKGRLPIILADQTTKVFIEYLPIVHIGYKDNEVAVDLWIEHDLENEDISLSKSIMHQLWFQLELKCGIWKEIQY